MAKVELLVDGQIFSANKDVLCDFSDYFRAMFSGNYLENDKQQIAIEALDAKYMKMILEYMNTGSLDLTESSSSTIRELARTADFLQITRLMQEIEHTLQSRQTEFTPASWMEIMIIAQESLFSQLEHQCAMYGLHVFRSMRPEYVPDLTTLCWYLSHPYLDAVSELDVFNFGYRWILQNGGSEEALLVVLGCLDIKKLTLTSLSKIVFSLSHNKKSLTTEVADYLRDLTEIGCCTSKALLQKETLLKEFCTERVYKETLHLVCESQSRCPTYTLVKPLSKNDFSALQFHTFTEKGFENWLEYPKEYIQCCRPPRTMQRFTFLSWNIIAWGLTKLVVSGFKDNIHCLKIYDTLKREWANCDPEEGETPEAYISMNYAHVIIGDLLYLISCSGYTFSTIIYDLKKRTYTRTIAGRVDTEYTEIVEVSTGRPAVCVHDGTLYAAGQSQIYKSQNRGLLVGWKAVVNAGIRVKYMTSFNGYIYCTQSHTNILYSFRPDVDDRLSVVTRLSSPPVAMYNLGNRLLFFTTSTREHTASMNAEEYYGNSPNEKPSVVWRKQTSRIEMNEINKGCSLVLTVPPLHPDISKYTKEHLKKFSPTGKKLISS